MGAGPLVAAAGILLLLRTGMHTSYLTDVLPAMLVFALGLAMTVAPLTATVLADADESDAGIASAINNAVARVAGLIGVSVVGVVVAGRSSATHSRPNEESVRRVPPSRRHLRRARCSGGVVGALGIVNPVVSSRPRDVPVASSWESATSRGVRLIGGVLDPAQECKPIEQELL